MRRPKDKIHVGIDLHSNNLTAAVVNQHGKRIAHRKLDCDLAQVLEFLTPWKQQIQSMAVESTFNWYWLVDALRDHDYPVDLANPAAIQQYNGIKNADDKHDAFHLAELQRLNILPKAYIYDAKLRPVRDMLRRRISLVQARSSLLLSFKSLHARTYGKRLDLSDAKKLKPKEAAKLYQHPANQLIAQIQTEHMRALDESIGKIEGVVLQCALQLPMYEPLVTLPGVGKILGMTITMEVGDIKRFKTDGDFASYCRTVDARHMSNSKIKSENNQKCGNKYLSWAMVEAANYARRFDPNCRRWFDRKAAKTSNVIATKALACKLSKAAWHVMRHGTSYDPARMFPQLANQTMNKK